MVSLFIRCSAETQELLSFYLWERGATGIVERDLPGGGVELQAFFEERIMLDGAPGYEARWQEEPETDWVRTFHDAWQPFKVGRRFFLAPEWSEEATPENRLRLPLRPGRACGSGKHPATQLALRALEDFLLPEETVLDVGTGSGILSEAALLLGARRVLACDIDPEAAVVAAQNLTHYGARVLVYAGSVRSVRTGAADFSVANINAESLCSLMPELARVTGRCAVVTGFPERDAGGVARAATRFFDLPARLAQDGWVALILMRG